jgi:hypothetical protein
MKSASVTPIARRRRGFWPYAATVFDGHIIGENDTIDAQTLPKVTEPRPLHPAHQGMTPGPASRLGEARLRRLRRWARRMVPADPFLIRRQSVRRHARGGHSRS